MTTIGRNDPCHCGSGKKYKKCHLEKDQIEDQKKRHKAALNAAKVAKEKEKAAEKAEPRHNWKEGEKAKKWGWMKDLAQKVPFMKSRGAKRGG